MSVPLHTRLIVQSAHRIGGKVVDFLVALLARNHAHNRILNQIFGVSRVIG